MRRVLTACLAAVLGANAVSIAQVAVPTQHNDNARTGANLSEKQLNGHNVADSSQFGRLWSYSVEGQVYAQPLYLEGLLFPAEPAVPGRKRNVVFIASLRNRVYAFDADDPDPRTNLIWQRDDLEPPAKLSDLKNDLAGGDNYKDILDSTVGIVSTPVLSTSLNSLFVVALTRQNGRYAHMLHALNLVDGRDRPGSPVAIAGSAVRAGSNEPIVFDSKVQLQRDGLLLLPVDTPLGGRRQSLIITFGSYGDKDKYRGWAFSYDAADLALAPQVFPVNNECVNCVPMAGVWQAGQGPAGDNTSGAVYFTTGNGDFDARTCANSELPLSDPSAQSV
jgi:hypothetical protein